MSEGPFLEVQGAARLAATLRKAGADLEDLRAANAAAASTVAGAARGIAPRRTGALAASVSPRATRRAAVVASRLPYAAPIHWGWGARNIAPRPFLSEAAQQTEPVWVGNFERALEAAINQVEGA